MNETTGNWQSVPPTQDPETGALVNCVLCGAVVAKASDRNLDLRERTVVARVRVGGTLRKQTPLPAALRDKIEGTLHVLAAASV